MFSNKNFVRAKINGLRSVLFGLFLFASFHAVVRCLEYRLDTNVLPDAYDITIKPFLLAEDGNKQFTFDGQVNITLHATTANVRNITLHADYIEILDKMLYDGSGNLLTNSILRHSIDTTTDKLTVELNDSLQVKTNYTLYFRYRGQIRTGLAGFYRASYIDAQGKLKWIGITQSQRISARTIVPCFDEPGMKATFKMKISRHRTYNAVFNTRLLESIPDGDDRYLDHFEATPRMSSYLLAFVVSDFTPRGNATLSVIARPEYYKKTELSHGVAQRTLAGYGAYFESPYKELGNSIMQKLASPVFPHNGMENWGLVIYKDAVLIQEPGYTDGWANKQYTTSIIVHETAHMWFGNSVTFAWWSYFWLNEAFARYYEYFFTHELYPEFEMDKQFVVNQIHLIFGIDATNNSQPLTSSEASIQSPSQIASKFSSITYAKGACIVRMFRNAMGHDNFDMAIRAYLKENHLKNTVPANLFAHLKQHWPAEQYVNLDELFYDWTEQVGFPYLKVSVATNRSTVSIEQRRFLLDPNDGSDTELKYTIPITYANNIGLNFGNLTPKFYMTNKESRKTLHFGKDHSPIEWIIFNVQQTGFYRVLYDTTTLRNIQFALEQANHSGIHMTNRAQLIDDLFNFAIAGMLDYEEVFKFLEYLAVETDYLPWYAAFSGLTRISQRTPLERQGSLGAFLIDVTSAAYKKLRFEAPNDTVLDIYNRNRIVKWSCKYGSALCQQDALAAHSSWLASDVKPNPDFRETSYCSGNRVGNGKHYADLYEIYKKENFTTEKELILRAMGCTRVQHVVQQHYELILTSAIPVEQKQLALTALYSENPESVSTVFKFITESIESLAEALGDWSSTANVISNIANYFTSEEQLKDLQKFIAEKSDLFGPSNSTLTKAVKTVEDNLRWTETHLTNLFKYLDGRNSAAAKTLTFTLIFFVSFCWRAIM